MTIARKAILCAIVFLGVNMNAKAQHSLQVDDGLGHYSLITGSNPGGTYTLPPGGGTLLTSSSVGSFAWLLGGNSLTGATTATPNEYIGSNNNYDVQFKTNGQLRMVLGANGFLSISPNPIVPAAPNYPLDVYYWDNTGTPSIYNGRFTDDLIPASTISTNIDVLHVNHVLRNSSANVTSVLDGVRQENWIYPSYTGTLNYTQGGNFNIFNYSPTTIGTTDAVIGSVYSLGSTAANGYGTARGVAGQILNESPGTIANAYSHWATISNTGGGAITNAYLFGAANSGSGGITNLYGLYLPQLTGATNITAIRYDHPTRPFVVNGNGDVGIDMNPVGGIALAVGTGGTGSSIVRLHKNFAASQYAALDFSPFGVISPSNPRWGTGAMGGSFPTANYSIWAFDGTNDNPHLTIDPNGFTTFMTGGLFATSYPLTQYHHTTSPTPPGVGTFVEYDWLPASNSTTQVDAVHISSYLRAASGNVGAVLDGLRQENWIYPDYTGTLDYAQGGNFNIYHYAPSTIANADGVVGSVYTLGTTAANSYGTARGAAGQVLHGSPGTITNAYAHWARILNGGGGTIVNAYLFGALDPASAGITNLYGLYLPQLTAATSITAIRYDHATKPFVVTGSGDVGVATSVPTHTLEVTGTMYQTSNADIGVAANTTNTFGNGGGTTTNSIGNNSTAATTTTNWIGNNFPGNASSIVNNIANNQGSAGFQNYIAGGYGSGTTLNLFGVDQAAGAMTNYFGYSSSGPVTNYIGSPTGGSTNTYYGTSTFAGAAEPSADNSQNLGASATRWANTYAVNTTTSNLQGANANKYAEQHLVVAGDAKAGNSVTIANSVVSGASSVVVATFVSAGGGGTATFVKSVTAAAGSVTITLDAPSVNGDVINYIVVNP